ncbi:GNAT family N-acetyltransferase [Paenibacillus sp. MMS18-CY102]|uniref:GNAT family N-acetyltransferase n=1 Tax=Paenibacillus sp. MMS18-CY102 TaxID=2682849 RepID=UPI0013656547|nr:GNAT family N-acetyltransferase [Paenibacillus sp. MMS18-CY102]MWC28082.1 GNAT family N-acetyltransferase [Paenibacillus sp. MMS18-CY102]
MTINEDFPFEIRRLYLNEISGLLALMKDVISRLPNQDLFAMDDEDYFIGLFSGEGEVYGAFKEGKLVAVSVLAFPGISRKNLGLEIGVLDHELHLVAVLDSTVVHESVRGQGLQRIFHELREKRAAENGYRYLYSTVHPDNHASVNNLVHAGFTHQFTRPMYGGKIRHCYAKRLIGK